MKRNILTLTALLLAAGASTHGAETKAQSLPAEVASPGYLDRIASPMKDRDLFFLFQPGQPAHFGIAATDGTVTWQKNAGLRPIVDYAWSADGRSVVFVTDCSQPAAELRSPSPELRSYFFVLDAATGTVQAQGDLDREVLNLQSRLPQALGAAHVIEELRLVDGVLHATILHQKTPISGSRALMELSRHDP